MESASVRARERVGIIKEARTSVSAASQAKSKTSHRKWQQQQQQQLTKSVGFMQRIYTDKIHLWVWLI